MSKRPTIQMIADMAGVSRGTVDRVLNNRSYVKPEVKEKILDIIKETGYLSPREAHQKSLISPLTPICLGVILPNWTGHFKSEILRGIQSAREELSDFQVTIILEECSTDIPGEVLELIDRLESRGMQGLAICAVNSPLISDRIMSLTKKGIPVITLNSDLPSSSRLCFVGQDYFQSGRIAAELLSKCIPSSGKILAVAGNLEFDGHRRRLNGFQERMNEKGITEAQITVIQTFNDYQTTYDKVYEQLELQPDLAAIYMANRSVAGCTQAVQALNRKSCLRIICHDFSESTRRLLSEGSIDFTISQNIYQQGYLPLIFLREYLQKGKLPENTTLNTSISIICAENMD